MERKSGRTFIAVVEDTEPPLLVDLNHFDHFALLI